MEPAKPNTLTAAAALAAVAAMFTAKAKRYARIAAQANRMPHQGARECARRRRQLAAGIIK